MYHLHLDINKDIFLISLEYNITILTCDILITLLKNRGMACLHTLVLFMYNEGKKHLHIRERTNFVQPTVS